MSLTASRDDEYQKKVLVIAGLFGNYTLGNVFMFMICGE